MTALSNVEFEKLVSDQAPRLRAIAKQRCDSAPTGFVTVADLTTFAKTLEYSGDGGTSRWLKNLAILAKSGKIAKLRSGSGTWEDHVELVHALHASDEIPFGLGQHIFVKDEGRYGSVVDYIPETKEYLVVLDPFQVKQYKKDDLKKVAHVVEGQYPDAWNDQPGPDHAKQSIDVVKNLPIKTVVELISHYVEDVLGGDGYHFLLELPAIAEQVANGGVDKTHLISDMTSALGPDEMKGFLEYVSNETNVEPLIENDEYGYPKKDKPSYEHDASEKTAQVPISAPDVAQQAYESQGDPNQQNSLPQRPPLTQPALSEPTPYYMPDVTSWTGAAQLASMYGSDPMKMTNGFISKFSEQSGENPSQEVISQVQAYVNDYLAAMAEANPAAGVTEEGSAVR